MPTITYHYRFPQLTMGMAWFLVYFLDGFFTDFTPRGYVGLLDRYTVSIAIFAAVILAAHGATYLRAENGRTGTRPERRLRSGSRGGGCAAAVGHLRRIRRGARHAETIRLLALHASDSSTESR